MGECLLMRKFASARDGKLWLINDGRQVEILSPEYVNKSPEYTQYTLYNPNLSITQESNYVRISGGTNRLTGASVFYVNDVEGDYTNLHIDGTFIGLSQGSYLRLTIGIANSMSNNYSMNTNCKFVDLWGQPSISNYSYDIPINETGCKYIALYFFLYDNCVADMRITNMWLE